MYFTDINAGCDTIAEVLCAAVQLGVITIRHACEEKLERMDACSALRVLETSHLEKIRENVKERMLQVNIMYRKQLLIFTKKSSQIFKDPSTQTIVELANFCFND